VRTLPNLLTFERSPRLYICARSATLRHSRCRVCRCCSSSITTFVRFVRHVFYAFDVTATFCRTLLTRPRTLRSVRAVHDLLLRFLTALQAATRFRVHTITFAVAHVCYSRIRHACLMPLRCRRVWCYVTVVCCHCFVRCSRVWHCLYLYTLCCWYDLVMIPLIGDAICAQIRCLNLPHATGVSLHVSFALRCVMIVCCCCCCYLLPLILPVLFLFVAALPTGARYRYATVTRYRVLPLHLNTTRYTYGLLFDVATLFYRSVIWTFGATFCHVVGGTVARVAVALRCCLFNAVVCCCYCSCCIRCYAFTFVPLLLFVDYDFVAHCYTHYGITLLLRYVTLPLPFTTLLFCSVNYVAVLGRAILGIAVPITLRSFTVVGDAFVDCRCSAFAYVVTVVLVAAFTSATFVVFMLPVVITSLLPDATLLFVLRYLPRSCCLVIAFRSVVCTFQSLPACSPLISSLSYHLLPDTVTHAFTLRFFAVIVRCCCYVAFHVWMFAFGCVCLWRRLRCWSVTVAVCLITFRRYHRTFVLRFVVTSTRLRLVHRYRLPLPRYALPRYRCVTMRYLQVTLTLPLPFNASRLPPFVTLCSFNAALFTVVYLFWPFRRSAFRWWRRFCHRSFCLCRSRCRCRYVAVYNAICRYVPLLFVVPRCWFACHRYGLGTCWTLRTIPLPLPRATAVLHSRLLSANTIYRYAASPVPFTTHSRCLRCLPGCWPCRVAVPLCSRWLRYVWYASFAMTLGVRRTLFWRSALRSFNAVACCVAVRRAAFVVRHLCSFVVSLFIGTFVHDVPKFSRWCRWAAHYVLHSLPAAHVASVCSTAHSFVAFAVCTFGAVVCWYVWFVYVHGYVWICRLLLDFAILVAFCGVLVCVCPLLRTLRTLFAVDRCVAALRW